MATLNINFTEAIPAPSNGYRVRYRVKGSLGAYTTLGPNPTSSPAIITGLLSSTEYEGLISSDCGGLFSAEQTFNTCTCAVGYTPTVDNDFCEMIDEVPATVLYSNYCLAGSTENAYSAYATRIYNAGFSNATIAELTPTIPSDVYAELFTPVLWTRTTPTDGPMNRAGVWIDSNCDGTVDGVLSGAQTTIAVNFVNSGATRTIYVGVGGDNAFDLSLDSVSIAVTPNSTSPLNFNIWHVFPVIVTPGNNIFNLIATSAGVVDSIGMTIYDNTAAELVAATSLGDLTIPFSTESLIGEHIDIATCSLGYTMDTSGGVGAYVCRATLTDTCNGA